jgi:hypothetical protein
MMVFTNNTFKIPEVMKKIQRIYLLLTDVILKKYMARKDLRYRKVRISIFTKDTDSVRW